MRNLGGAIGIAVCGTILNDRTNTHFLHLAEHLNAGNDAMNEMLQTVAGNLSAWGLNAADVQQGDLKQLWNLTMREALTQTFSDAFFVVMVCFAITTMLVPLMKKVAAPKGPSADAH